MTEISKNIPMPKVKTNIQYPWDDLEVGDSFLLNPGNRIPKSNITHANLRYFPKKFTIRKTEEGFRAWRIE